eukprot:jgi/Tetstr1/447213/TSEL_034650.t1
MGLKENSSVVSILLGVLLAAIAVAEITFVVLTGNQNIRIFLVSSALGIFVVLGLATLRVVQNDNDIEDAHKAISDVSAKECPDYWTRSWNSCSDNYVCSPVYTLPDGTEMKMRPGTGTLDLANYNQESADSRCETVLNPDASFPFTDMVNRCNARNRVV